MFLPSRFLGAVVGFLLCLLHLEASKSPLSKKEPTAIEKLESFKQAMCEAINQDSAPNGKPLVDSQQPLTIIVVTRKNPKDVQQNPPLTVDSTLFISTLTQLEDSIKDKSGLVLVIFNEKFFWSNPLTRQQKEDISQQLAEFSADHKNVLIYPHFLYIDDKGPTFADQTTWEKFRTTYLDYLNPAKGRFGKFSGEKAPAEPPNFAYHEAFFNKHPYIHPSTSDNSTKVIDSGEAQLSVWEGLHSQLRLADKPPRAYCSEEQTYFTDYANLLQNTSWNSKFIYLRSESIMYCLGKTRTRYKKASYWNEANDVLLKYPAGVVIYDIGSGVDEKCGDASDPVANVIIKYLSSEICFDVQRGIRKHNNWTNPGQPQSVLHILQSNSITMSSYYPFNNLPSGVTIIQSDPNHTKNFCVIK